MDPKAEFTKIRDAYKNVGDQKIFTGLIMGAFSTGKTTLLGTGRKPVLIDSFDPAGAVVLRDQIEKGEVLVRDYSVDDFRNPKAYNRWEEQWEKDIRNGLFKHIGTYAIDSLTTFLTALSYAVGKKAGRPAASLAIQDYNIIYATLGDVISLSSAQGCDFMMTAHIAFEKDDVLGDIQAEISTFKGLKTKLPILFSERYVMRKVATTSKVGYELLTNDRDKYKAGSRLARNGVLDIIEKPDIKAILAKAGYSTEDKQLFM